MRNQQKGISSYQTRPAGDSDFVVQYGGEEDEEQEGEEEGCTADKLEKVERTAADTAVDHLLQDEGHKRQELMETERQRQRERSQESKQLKHFVSPEQ